MQTRSASTNIMDTQNIQNIQNTQHIKNKCKQFLYKGWCLTNIYVVWILMHHAAANLYATYCTPITFFGILAAPFIIATPHCVGLRWCINRGADTMIGMWIVLGTWCTKRILSSTRSDDN
jgi:hypothetical protein